MWIRALGLFIILATAGESCWADSPRRRGPDYSQTLCAPAEHVYFSCSIGRKTVSLCGSEQVTEASGYLQYRFGLIGKEPELVYPSTQTHPRGHFRDFLFPTAQTWSYEIGFKRGDYSYWIFMYTASQAETLGYGVFVGRDGEPVRKLSCTAHIYDDAGALERMHGDGVIEHLRDVETGADRFWREHN